MFDKKYYGVDVLAFKNIVIKLVMDGFIFFFDWMFEMGNIIGIQYFNNIIIFYKYNFVLLKEVGSFVKVGEVVVIIGNIGILLDGLYLYFEFWYKGKLVDLVEYIKF